MKKFEARIKDETQKTYGVWNNDMLSWQYIFEWDCNETLSISCAEFRADELNNRLIDLNNKI